MTLEMQKIEDRVEQIDIKHNLSARSKKLSKQSSILKNIKQKASFSSIKQENCDVKGSSNNKELSSSCQSETESVDQSIFTKQNEFKKMNLEREILIGESSLRHLPGTENFV